MKPAQVARVHWVDQRWFIRLWEIIPGALSWSILILPIILSIFVPLLVVYLIIAFDLYWTMRSFRLSVNLIRSYRRLKIANRTDWSDKLTWLHDPSTKLVQKNHALETLAQSHPQVLNLIGNPRSRWRQKYHDLRAERDELQQLVKHERLNLNPDDIYHAVILATYNESMDILEPSIQALTQVDYRLDRIMLVLAYEERGGGQTEKNVTELIQRYGDQFALALAVKHPANIAGEVKGGGKGPNITHAGRQLTAEVQRRGIEPEHVVVTTFDSDHRASSSYFSYLSYVHATDPNRVHKSYQPIAMFLNNIWDAPAAMRVIATGNTFWQMMEMMRPHRLRNFAAHAQSLAALIATDYWSVTTIVEDGHQFWRTYFAYDGDHQVVPIFTPIFQDAVLTDSYPKTFKAQFLQLRRWAWGASDVQYVVRNSIKNTRIPWSNKLLQISRLLEGHISWATTSLIIAGAAWLPLYLNPTFAYQTLAHELPNITSRINSISSVTILLTAYISLLSLPPRPARYRRSRSVFMLLQWGLLPFTSIFFGTFAALNSQTRLMLGRHLEFYVTEKATKK